MLKVIVKTISGMFFVAMGIGIIYFYLTHIDNGSSPLLLIASFCTIIVGIFILVNAGKSDETVIQKQKFPSDNQAEEARKQSVNLIERNNAITQDWLKSSEKRDKLKLLEMAANEEKNASQPD